MYIYICIYIYLNIIYIYIYAIYALWKSRDNRLAKTSQIRRLAVRETFAHCVPNSGPPLKLPVNHRPHYRTGEFKGVLLFGRSWGLNDNSWWQQFPVGAITHWAISAKSASPSSLNCKPAPGYTHRNISRIIAQIERKTILCDSFTSDYEPNGSPVGT